LKDDSNSDHYTLAHMRSSSSKEVKQK